MAIVHAVFLFAVLAWATECSVDIVDELVLVQKWAGSSQPQPALGAHGKGSARSKATPLYLPYLMPVPVKIPFPTSTTIFNPYKHNATRFWNPAYDPEWVNPTRRHQPTKKPCYTKKGEKVDAACVTTDGQWWSVEDDWPLHECDDFTCVRRCNLKGERFNSDLGDNYGPGTLRLCHQRHVVECERIKIEEDCSRSFEMYGLTCLGWAGDHCMPVVGAKCSDITTEAICLTGAFAHMGCIWNQKGCVLPDKDETDSE
uniref:Uncharacterized protein n=1 Tax=Pyrodinium bahamense TaxID=73915 RepID=A0A7S0FDC0_9DINO